MRVRGGVGAGKRVRPARAGEGARLPRPARAFVRGPGAGPGRARWGRGEQAAAAPLERGLALARRSLVRYRAPAESEAQRAPLTAAAGGPSRCPPPAGLQPRAPRSRRLCARPLAPGALRPLPPAPLVRGGPRAALPARRAPRGPAAPSRPPARGRRRCVYMRGGIRTADSGPQPALLFLKSLSARRHWPTTGRVTRGAGPSASARPHCLPRPRSPRGPGPAPLFGGSGAIVLPAGPGQREGALPFPGERGEVPAPRPGGYRGSPRRGSHTGRSRPQERGWGAVPGGGGAAPPQQAPHVAHVRGGGGRPRPRPGPPARPRP